MVEVNSVIPALTQYTGHIEWLKGYDDVVENHERAILRDRAPRCLRVDDLTTPDFGSNLLLSLIGQVKTFGPSVFRDSHKSLLTSDDSALIRTLLKKPESLAQMLGQAVTTNCVFCCGNKNDSLIAMKKLLDCTNTNNNMTRFAEMTQDVTWVIANLRDVWDTHVSRHN